MRSANEISRIVNSNVLSLIFGNSLDGGGLRSKVTFKSNNLPFLIPVSRMVESVRYSFNHVAENFKILLPVC